MRYDSNYIRGVLRDLQRMAERVAAQFPGLRNMLVLPPGEGIHVPVAKDLSATDDLTREPGAITTFAKTRIAGQLPPPATWPDAKPLQAVVAECDLPSYKACSQRPYRVHLFFGGSEVALEALRRLSDFISTVQSEATRAMFGDHSPFEHGVFYVAQQPLRGARMKQFDSWLCTVHWWAWAVVDSPIHVHPRIVYGGSDYETDRRDDAFTSMLGFSLLNTDIFTATAATLGLILRFLDEPPPMFWDADYPDLPKPEQLKPVDVANMADEFIELVMDYLDWDKTRAMTAAVLPTSAPGSFAADGIAGDIMEQGKLRNAAAAKIRRYGPVLAAGLERHGLDSAVVLSIVHRVGLGGGGPSHVWPTWERERVAIQQAAVRVRQHGNGSGHRDDPTMKRPEDPPGPSPARRSHKGGRPPLAPEEAHRRGELVEQWTQAKQAGVGQKDFATGKGISPAYLEKCINWDAQRRRRNNKLS